MKHLVDIFSYREILKAVDKGKYLGNRRCHINSFSYAKRHPTKVKRIVGCLQVFSDSHGVAHFVVELNDGTIVDPTFGNMSSTLYSYLIPLEYYKVDSFNPERELTNLKTFLYNQLPWYLKINKTKGVDL